VGYLVKSTPGPELRAALLRNILGKLHLSRRQELIRYALEHGIE
jgi:hypothetical protein